VKLCRYMEHEGLMSAIIQCVGDDIDSSKPLDILVCSLHAPLA
jgi:hypothetical protein